MYFLACIMNAAPSTKSTTRSLCVLHLGSCRVVVVVCAFFLRPTHFTPLLWQGLDVAHRIVQDATCYGHHYFRVSAVWSRFSCWAAFNTHSLYTNGERQLAASIVAPLRKTKPELSAHLLLISFRSYCIKNQLRSREWSKKRERASFLCIWVVFSLGVLTSGSARRIIIHSALWQARVWLIDSRSGKKPWDALVLFEGLFSYCFGKEDFARSLSLSRGKNAKGTYRRTLLAELAVKDWLHRSLERGAWIFWGKHIPRLEFACLFPIHPGHIGDIFFIKGRRGSVEGDGAEGTYPEKFLRLRIVECSWKYWNVADDSLAVKLSLLLPASFFFFFFLHPTLHRSLACMSLLGHYLGKK